MAQLIETAAALDGLSRDESAVPATTLHETDYSAVFWTVQDPRGRVRNINGLA